MATKALASWAVNLSYSSLPPEVVRAAVASFYNYAGCAIGGSNHPTATKASTALAPFFGTSTSSILGSQGKQKADAQHAALINGIACHIHDYDDTHLETIIHPAGPVASALFAYAEVKRPVNGKDFILALVAGIEAECKCGLAVWPAHYDIGWHITSTTGSIGAAVAVGKLLNLSVEQMQHAIGIAATQVTGLREMFGSDTKSFHPGRAAQNGLLAAVLASKEYTSSLTALEAKRGWANVVDAKPHQLDKYMASLGKEWETAKNSFKPFPCGIVIHPVIDGCVQVRKDMQAAGANVEDIESIHAKVHHLVLELTGKRTPKDGLEAKFSVYHGGAIGLVFGKGTPSQYDDSVVVDPKVTSVRDKMTATADESIRADETIIEVKMKDGKTFQKHITHAIGSLEVPLTEDLLQTKFLDQAELVIGAEGAKKASERCWALESVDDVASIAEVL
ncbi:mmge/prpd family protein-like protein [Rhizodiscina lignyota]|uniref:Mmge/prpd family protein-like protein n=1 Tax=Rhizodiscina lignyota TaxID=1504668 RepID=A0A9P4I570_9PEZI|nr:mmge/prpd family protein-like protein [Rhizodiscina lignyota]